MSEVPGDARQQALIAELLERLRRQSGLCLDAEDPIIFSYLLLQEQGESLERSIERTLVLISRRCEQIRAEFQDHERAMHEQIAADYRALAQQSAAELRQTLTTALHATLTELGTQLKRQLHDQQAATDRQARTGRLRDAACLTTILAAAALIGAAAGTMAAVSWW